MALFYNIYKRNAYQTGKTYTSSIKGVVRPGVVRLSVMIGVSCIRLCTYILLARIVGVQSFGVFLLVQWVAAAPLPLIGIGIDALSRRNIALLQGQESPHSAASIFHMLWHRQRLRIVCYALLYIPLASLFSWISKGSLSLPLLLFAGLAVVPLYMSSIVGIALQSQRRHMLLAFFSILNALLTLVFILLATILPENNLIRIDTLLLLPAFAQILTLTLALFSLSRILPLRRALPVGPLLEQRLQQAFHVSPLSFLVDICTWRELPLFLLLLIIPHPLTSLTDITCYAFSLLLCSRLIEAVPMCFVTCLLPMLARLFQRIMARPLSYGTYSAFIQTTCYISLLATIICMLLTFFCPQLIVLSLGKSYLPMVKLVRILLIAVACSSIATVSLTQLERRSLLIKQRIQNAQQIRGSQHIQEHRYVRAGTVIIYIVLMIPCIALWGIVGAALASMIVRASLALCSIIQCHRMLRATPYASSHPCAISLVERSNHE